MTRDLTEGSPMKLVSSFTLPLIFGFLFQQLYSMVDTLIVGKYLGTSALAAVGATGSLNFLILGFLMGMCGGFSIPVAQSYGARDIPLLRRYVINGAILSAIIAVMMTVATVLPLRGILRLMRTPDDIIDMSYRYIVVILLGIPVTVFYNFIAGVIRAMGDSRTPVFYLTLASVLNIALDLLFMLGFGMGVTGAALATVLSQAVSGALCFLRVKRSVEALHFTKEDWRAEPTHIKTLICVGLPMGLQYSITAIGSVVLQSAVNGIGSAAVASVTAANKLSMLFVCVFDALGTTAATFAGQNVGARKFDRVKRGVAAEGIIGGMYALAALLAIWLFGRNLVRMFVDASETEVVENAYHFLCVLAVFYIPLLFVNVVRFTVQGMGFTSFAVLAGVMEMAARSVVGIVFVPVFGFEAACFASPMAWILADMFLFPAFFHVLKKVRAS